jgi:hypothetical protein
MTETVTAALPSSISGARLVVGFLAGQLMLAPGDVPAIRDTTYPKVIDYKITNSTIGDYVSVTSHSQLSSSVEPLSMLQDFFYDLLSKQEDLGGEFEKILHANLWNLYAR